MSSINRREFMNRSAKTLAAGAAMASVARAGASANEQLNVAVIGVRGRGKGLISDFLGNKAIHVAAVCDVDDAVIPSALEAAKKAGQEKTPKVVKDLRQLLDDKDVDALVIAAPDHWHAPATIWGCQAGKDVYCEKPVSHNLVEGRLMVDAARKYNRVVQVGTQRRSSEAMLAMVDYLQSGRIGKIAYVRTWINSTRPNIGHAVDGPTPAGVDYDLWLGAAPKREFNKNRFHYTWHWFWDYGTGECGNNGIHALDLAQWGIGNRRPIRVSCGGGKHTFDDDQETPDTQLVTLDYPDLTLTWEHRTWSKTTIAGQGFGVAFYGTNGTLITDGGGWRVVDGESEDTHKDTPYMAAHVQDFVDCVKSREKPNADIEIGHRSTSLCHLGNIAYRTQATLVFDADDEEFIGPRADEGNRLLWRSYRKPFELTKTV
jgi:predicted dehydrogenase